MLLLQNNEKSISKTVLPNMLQTKIKAAIMKECQNKRNGRPLIQLDYQIVIDHQPTFNKIIDPASELLNAPEEKDKFLDYDFNQQKTNFQRGDGRNTTFNGAEHKKLQYVQYSQNSYQDKALLQEKRQTQKTIFVLKQQKLIRQNKKISQSEIETKTFSDYSNKVRQGQKSPIQIQMVNQYSNNERPTLRKLARKFLYEQEQQKQDGTSDTLQKYQDSYQIARRNLKGDIRLHMKPIQNNQRENTLQYGQLSHDDLLQRKNELESKIQRFYQQYINEIDDNEYIKEDQQMLLENSKQYRKQKRQRSFINFK